MQKVAALERLEIVKIDMSQYGMTMADPLDGKTKLVKKRTKIMTISPEAA